MRTTDPWRRRDACSEHSSGIRVVCLCTYRTTRAGRWADADFAAFKLIRALKGKPVSGWARVPVGPGEWIRFDETSRQLAVDAFARVATWHVDWRAVAPVVLVPIPNSNCTVLSDETPRTRLLAEAVVRHASDLDLTVADVLRWSEPTGAAHDCVARRYPEQLYPLLRLVRPLGGERPVVLVDDVMTTGGHMRAAAACLTAFHVPVLGGLCAGISDDRTSEVDAFAVRVEPLEPFAYESAVLDDVWTVVSPHGKSDGAATQRVTDASGSR